MSVRALKTFFVLFLWLFATNHCFAANLTASQHQSPNNHDCCGEHHGQKGSKNSNESSHSSCDDEGCCQPVIKGTENLSLSQSSVLAAQWIPVDSFSYESRPKTFTDDIQWPLALAPPRVLNPLLSSLQSAPNAPPLFS